MSWPPADGKPYQPANGTEGIAFMEGWCWRCKNDANQDCPIIANSMAFSPGDAGYPVEWVWKCGEPICTAFDDRRERISNDEREAQMVLL